ncbi:signal peptidase I [Leptospira broomii serovar Hurstbridge str. 5399]|uniref:Signal peptidase I n=1 Tax=Leptospira broomii serovar Hurstbridge str. 5399 TaxID=1049789 RepID=T0F881_9LEPT|nr:signal peptidase I [Leptospira broomii]EQA44096.1 signal peptidase I [Leptospira broomii serovar Hurstbridge str. 5399]
MLFLTKASISTKFPMLLWIKKALPVFLAIISVLYLRIFIIQFYFINGNSMMPSFKDGDLILVKKWGFPARVGPWTWSLIESKIDRFDVLVLDGVGTELSLKRVVGLPGDFFRFSEGRIHINDSSLEEPFVKPGFKTQAPSLSIVPVVSVSGNIGIGDSGRIPPGYFLVLGDNREFSTDSRNYGLIPFQKLRGKVLLGF